ncbi:MAG: hypothetical protein QF903_07690 [Planctomycetota bacterium]|jgi:hypothetical protein|nr:hypothetical protein [Planctomycetota bacterium]MDP6762246.1 hypothetical protein [Planctomycetota bacterium]MDP6989347.1 hypothetical protein [Planctomycetota bacterium]
MLRLLAVLCAVALSPVSLAQSQRVAPVKPAPASKAHLAAKKATAAAPFAVPANPGGYLGGTDACTTPMPISGQGAFPFDQTAATTGPEGQSESICLAFGTSAIDFDVWFAWTADATGAATVTTCNGASHDTKLAAYPGAGCPTAGSALACNDDACGLQSSICFGVVNSWTYTLQVGTFPGAAAGAGLFTTSIGTGVNGSDDCATATAISGQGTFFYDLTSATTGTEGQSESLCCSVATCMIDGDVWYNWTADATGQALLTTCGLSVDDTKIAVYPGTNCPTTGSSLACNDDACGLQTTLCFPVTAGTDYTLQLGTYPGKVGCTGEFSITIGNSGGGADDCAMPDPIAGQGSFNFDTTCATTGTEGQSESLCFAFGTSGINFDVWFAWTADCSGPTEVSTCAGASHDTKIAAYQGNGCPTSGLALACNDDTCGLQSTINFQAQQGSTYTLQIGSFPGATAGSGSFSVLTSPCDGGGPGTADCFGDGAGTTCPCGNAGGAGEGCGNSTGAGCTLTGTGSASIGAADLVLAATGALPGQPGLFFQGNNFINGGNGVVFGDGIRCCGSGVVRLQIVVPDSTGAASTSVDIAGTGGAAVGDTKCYQYWYRDPLGSPCGTNFNLSNSYGVTWAP